MEQSREVLRALVRRSHGTRGQCVAEPPARENDDQALLAGRGHVGGAIRAGVGSKDRGRRPEAPHCAVDAERQFPEAFRDRRDALKSAAFLGDVEEDEGA